jgi:hypothetical protein
MNDFFSKENFLSPIFQCLDVTRCRLPFQLARKKRKKNEEKKTPDSAKKAELEETTTTIRVDQRLV